MDLILLEMQVGNAALDTETDSKGMIDYAWSHSLISDGLHEAITKNCDYRNYSDDCWMFLDRYYDLYKIMDMYSLYSPTCPQGRPFAASSMRIQSAHLSTVYTFLRMFSVILLS